MERRLAAILAADVVGYSRLIREDEASTLAALKAHREELIEPKLAQYHGRIVKLMGDGLLTEFPSAVEAVQCVVEPEDRTSRRTPPRRRCPLSAPAAALFADAERKAHEVGFDRRALWAFEP